MYKDVLLCKNCGSAKIYDFEFDPDRGGLARTLRKVNDDSKDLDRYYFELDGKVCMRCGSIDQTYWAEVPEGQDLDKPVNTELEYQFVVIARKLKTALENEPDFDKRTENRELLEATKSELFFIMRKYNITAFVYEIKHLFKVVADRALSHFVGSVELTEVKEEIEELLRKMESRR